MMQHGSSVFTRAKQGEVRVRFPYALPTLKLKEDPDFEDGRGHKPRTCGGLLKVDIAEKQTVVPRYLQQGCKPHQKLDFTQRDPYQTSDLYNSKIKFVFT